MTISNPQLTFIISIKEKIRLAQYEALKEVNTQLIKLYWEIGKDISEKQKKIGVNQSFRSCQKNYRRNSLELAVIQSVTSG